MLFLLVCILATMASASLGTVWACVTDGFMYGILWAVISTIESLETKAIRKRERPEWS